MDTLIKRIKELEMSSLKGSWKEINTKIREELEELRKTNELVERVVSREITFTEEFNSIFGEYGGFRPYVPYSVPDGFKEKVAELEECLGESPITSDYYSNILGNPFGLGAVMGLAFFGIPLLPPPKLNYKQISRRDSLTFLGLLGAMGASLGAVLGASGSEYTQCSLRELDSNAHYLDLAVKRAYSE